MAKRIIPLLPKNRIKFSNIIIFTVILVFFLSFIFIESIVFLGMGGAAAIETFINENIQGRPPKKTIISYKNDTTNTLKSFANYSIDIPIEYHVLEENRYGPGFTIIENTLGKIGIYRTSTQYSDLQSHLNHIQDSLSDSQELKIDNHDAIKGHSVRNGYIYYIFVEKGISKNNTWVYWISSENPKLESDIDHIAQSFRFIQD